MLVPFEALRKIIDQFPWGVILAGEDGEVFQCNGKAPLFLETDAMDLMERGVAAAPAWSGLAEAVRSLGLENHRQQSTEFVRGRACYSLTVSRVGLELFGRPCLVAWIVDITLQKDLVELRDGLFADFLRRLKGPLTSVKTSLAILGSEQYSSLDPDAREVVCLGHAEIQRLSGLLSDMGDLFALEGNTAGASLYLEHVDVQPFLLRCLRRARKHPLAAGRELALVGPPGGASARVTADYEKLGLVLGHLVANALAYSPAGSPVRVSWAAQELMVEIRVQDWGPGIAAEDLPRMFDKFFVGEGLGLFISKGYVELMGGSLRLENASGAGAVAVMRMPACEEGMRE